MGRQDTHVQPIRTEWIWINTRVPTPLWQQCWTVNQF